MWRDLAVRAAQAAAHGDGEQELTLTTLQLQVEQAITDRHPELSGVMDELLVWEGSLAHSESGLAGTTCLTCRRARVGLPDNLPMLLTRAGVR